VRNSQLGISEDQIFNPAFINLVRQYPPGIKLPLQHWEALRPLLSFRDSVLDPDFCSPWTDGNSFSGHSLGVFGNLQLHLALLGITSHAIPERQPEFQMGLHSLHPNDVVRGVTEGEGIFISFAHISMEIVKNGQKMISGGKALVQEHNTYPTRDWMIACILCFFISRI
jgi:hypothetical protein